MASKVTIDILYVYDAEKGSFFEGITAIKVVNGKIEEINFRLKERVERRNDIDFIVKKHSSITLLFMEKEFILRITDNMIKIISSKRSRGVAFEVGKSQMANLNIFDGVKAKLFVSTQEIGPRDDSLIGNDEVELPEFISLMTKEEMDNEFEERRKRRDEKTSQRDSIVGGKSLRSTPVKREKEKPTRPTLTNSRTDTLPNGAISNTIDSAIKNKIHEMNLEEGNDDDESENLESGDDNDDDGDGAEDEDYIIEMIKKTDEDYYEFPIKGKNAWSLAKDEELSAPELFEWSYSLKLNKGMAQFTRNKGSTNSLSYFRLSLDGHDTRYLAKIKK